MKKRTKKLIGIIAGAVAGGVTLTGIIVVFFVFFLFGGPAKKNTDAGKYEETIAYYYPGEPGHRVRTGFLTFPDSIPSSAFEDGREPDFYFWYRDTWNAPTCEAYLLCTYDDEDYSAEIRRLRNTVKEFEDERIEPRQLIYEDSDRFSHPVYMAIDHSDYSYEYAMDLGGNAIAYVYTAWKRTFGSVRKIPTEYLPSDFEESLGSENGSIWADDNFNIYSYPDNIGGVPAIIHDY